MQSLNTFNITVNNALVLITIVSISDAILPVHQTNALEFEICFNGDFSLFIMFFVCFFSK